MKKKKIPSGTMLMTQISLGICEDVPKKKKGRPSKAEKEQTTNDLFDHAKQYPNVIPFTGFSK